MAIQSKPQNGVNSGAETELDLLQMISMLKRKWLFVVGATVLSVVMAGLISHFTPPTYETVANILVADQQNSFSGQMAFLGAGSSGSEQLENRLQVINSPLILNQASILLHEQGNAEAAENLRRRVNTSIVARTDVIRIAVQGATAEIAKLSADAIVEAYQTYSEKRAKEQAVRLVDFLDSQVSQTLIRVEETERAVRDFQQDVGIIYLSSEEAKVNQHMAGLESQLMNTEIRLEESRLRLAHIEGDLARTRQELPESTGVSSKQLLEELQKLLASLQATRVEYVSRGLFGTPEIRQLDARIDSMTSQIQGHLRDMVDEAGDSRGIFEVYQELTLADIQLRAEISSLQDRIGLIKQRITEYQQQLWTLSDHAFTYARLEREVIVSNRTYGMLIEELERARIAVERELGDLQVLRTPTLPATPISPRIPLNIAIGMVLGLFVGVGLVFTLEFLDNTIKNRSQLESLGLPLLGVIPKITKNKHQQDGESSLLEVGINAMDFLAAAYVRVEINLRFANLDAQPKVISITSAIPGEGKSTTSVNFSYILAQSGQRVLIIDGDLRKPVLHKTLGGRRSPGLSEIVSGQMELEDGIRAVSLNGVNFDVITAGTRPPSIPNLFHSQSFADLLAQTRETYDWIIVDLPPIHAGPESLEVSKLADGAIFVIETGKTPIPTVEEAKIQMDQTGVITLGAILNQYDEKLSGYDYYSSYYSSQDETLEE